MINLDKYLDLKNEKLLFSKHTIDFYRPEVLKKIYGRENIALKIFKRGWFDKISIDYKEFIPEEWNFKEVDEVAQCSNLASYYGVCPRVYDIVSVGDDFGLVVEYINIPKGFKFSDRTFTDYRLVLDNLGIKYYQQEILDSDQFIATKLVDTNSFLFTDFNSYKKKLYERIKNIQERGEQSYQSFDGIQGKRETWYRIKMLRMDKNDFNGKIVLDLGCSLGAFCHEAIRRGAKRVIGVDSQSVIEVARELAGIHSYYNIDFVSADLSNDSAYEIIKEKTGIKDFDIIFWLSMEQHVGKHSWIFEHCKELIYCEEATGRKDIVLPDKFRTVELGELDKTFTNPEEDKNRRILKGYVRR